MIGTSLGPYKIIEQLGAGGMGEVYLGEDTRLGRKVAIKVPPPEGIGADGALKEAH
jgi:serine/threonine-protein kinase